MAKSLIKSNAKEFVKRLGEAERQYHNAVMRGMAANLDLARGLAVSRHMIRFGTAGTKAVMTRRGPKTVPITDPVKVSIRTGRLKRAIEARGSWRANRSGTENKFSTTSPYLKMWIRPQSTAKSNHYLARFHMVAGGDKAMDYRLKHETGGNVRGNFFRQIDPSLRFGNRGYTIGNAMRETGMSAQSIHVRARPFIGPALNEVRPGFENLVYNHLKKMDTVKV